MATYCSSGTSSGSGSGSSAKSSVFQNIISSSSNNKINNHHNNNNHNHTELDLDHDEQLLITEQRKRKRRVSNRDSARRSRLRKKKYEDDLTSQLLHLNKEKSLLISEINSATQKYSVFEAENWVLRAQGAELTNRLHSLREIISFLTLPNQMINTYSAADAYYNNLL